MARKSILFHLSSANEVRHLTEEEIDPLVACLDQPYRLDPPSLIPLFTENRQRVREQTRLPEIPSHIVMTEEAERKRFVGSMRKVLGTVEYWDTRRMQFPIKNVAAGETQLNPFTFTSIRTVNGEDLECSSYIHLIRLCKTETTYAPNPYIKPFRDISTRAQSSLRMPIPLSPEILGRVAREELGEIINYCDDMGFKWWLMAVQKTKIPLCTGSKYNVTERRPLMFMPGGAFPLPVSMEADEEGRPSYTQEIIANFTERYTRTSLPMPI